MEAKELGTHYFLGRTHGFRERRANIGEMKVDGENTGDKMLPTNCIVVETSEERRRYNQT